MLGALLIPAMAQAQLAPTTWVESIDIFAGFQGVQVDGLDDAAPEVLDETLSGSDYSIEGALVFGPPGPPDFRATTQASYTSGNIPIMFGTTHGQVDFEVRVVQIGEPPVAVSEVPITIEARGIASAEGSPLLAPHAYALLTVSGTSGSFFSEGASVGEAGADTFDVTLTQPVAPGEVLTGSMEALAGVGAEILQAGITASAMGWIDPHFSISDEIIPGTSSSYRDYFDIEYGEGYWALGNPTPNSPSTWGRIKARYTNR